MTSPGLQGFRADFLGKRLTELTFWRVLLAQYAWIGMADLEWIGANFGLGQAAIGKKALI